MKLYTILFLVLGSCFFLSCGTPYKKLTSKKKLIPWSIVAFDSLERTPAQRVDMVKKLGYHQYAFGGRQKHINTLPEEIDIARKNNINVAAVWLYLNHNKDSVGKLKPMSEQVFEALKSRELNTEIWVGFHQEYFEGLSEEQSLHKAIAMVQYIAQRAEELNCTIALYNHGGWYGKAVNQIKIIEALPQYSISVVYNFHHSHKNLSTYKEDILSLLPYLSCVSVSGVHPQGPKILTIGKGTEEKEMVSFLLQHNYKGPWAILGHVKGGNPSRILEENYQGWVGLLQSL